MTPFLIIYIFIFEGELNAKTEQNWLHKIDIYFWILIKNVWFHLKIFQIFCFFMSDDVTLWYIKIIALKRGGYGNISLSFHQSSTSHVKRQRHRNIIWFNTPCSRAVITNVAKKFLQLIDLHFPPSNKFHKIFHRNNVKVSYCCTQNVGNIIKSNNKKLINSSNHHEQPCNCRKKKIVLWKENAERKT